MRTKKARGLIVLFLCLSVFALAGCGKKNQAVLMDQLAEDDLYHYSNPDLGFTIELPKEFQYYQTQSKVEDGYKALQILIPTGDRTYSQMEVDGYAKPIEVRSYDEAKWNESPDKNILKQPKAVGKKVLAIKYWDKIPADWNSKWTPEMEEQISKSLSVK